MLPNNEPILYYQNCGGLKTKMSDIRVNILSQQYDIIIFTETWLQPNIYDSELFDSRYSVVRRDRDLLKTKKKEGGGVLIAINKNLNFSRKSEWENKDLEEIYVMIPFKNKNLIINTIYIPPAAPLETYEKYFTNLQSIFLSNPDSVFCAAGDYNLPDISWSFINNSPCGISDISSSSASLLSNNMSLMNIQQYNYLTNDNNRSLDLIFSSICCDLSAPCHVLSSPDRHHPPLEFRLNLKKVRNIPINDTKKYNFPKANFVAICKALSEVDWQTELVTLLPSQAVDRFYDILYNIVDKHVPLKKKRSHRYPVWFSRPLISSLKRKHKVWSKWKTYNCLSHYNEFSFLRARCKRLLAGCFRDYLNNVQKSLKDNPKAFFQYTSNLKSNDSGYPNTMSYGDDSSKDPLVICNMFSSFFSSVLEPLSTIMDDDLQNIDPLASSPVITNISLTEFEVRQSLKQLYVNKGPGPDRVSPLFVKRTCDYISKPLTILYNKCLNSGFIPERWKIAYITPIHKTGSKKRIEHYRPISIISCFPKILERLIHNRIYPCLHNCLLEEQHGFIKNRSTTTNLLIYSNYLFEGLDKRTQIDAIYTDFRKAFDKVDHRILLIKLAEIGIKGSLLNFFKSYLSDRKQVVVVNGFRSNPVLITSGVPQGSILGPLLYVVFINDINKCFQHCNYLLYADDLKIFSTVSDIADCHRIQEDLDRLDNYCTMNKLHLAYDKCQHITFSNKRSVVPSVYNIGGRVLSKVETIKDLGITFDAKLKFDVHVEKICNKALKMLGFVLRSTKKFKNLDAYLTLYRSLIRPQLEYATCVWNPLYAVYSKKIEMVQKKFLRAMHRRLTSKYMSYQDLLKEYNIMTLSKRRLFFDTNVLRNVCMSSYDCSTLINNLRYCTHRKLRHPKLFHINLTTNNYGARAPMHRACDQYNKLFSHIDIFHESDASFKRKLREHLDSIPE